MLCFNFFFFLFITSSYVYICSAFSFEYQRQGNSFTIGIEIDNHNPINYDARINTVECISTVPMNESFIYDTKRIVKDDSKPISYRHIDSKLYKSIVTFKVSTPKISMQNMLMYVYTVPYIKDKTSNAKVNLGFSYKFHDLKFSFIHHLYELKIIQKRAFSFLPINISAKRSIGFFGEISKETLSNYTYKYMLPVDDKYITWGINLNSIKLSTNSSNNIGEFTNTGSYAYLNTNEDRLFVPIEFFQYINETIFSDLYKDGTCELNKGSNWYINCNHTKIMLIDFPDITFNFGSAEIKLGKEDTFKLLSKERNFFIIQSSGKENDKYLFGSFLFDKYIIEFDYDNNAVVLYSSFPLSSSNKSNNDNIMSNIGYDKKYTIKKACLWLLIFLLVSMIIYFLIQKKFKYQNHFK